MKTYKHTKTGAIATYTKGAGYYIMLNDISYGYMSKSFVEDTKDWKLIKNKKTSKKAK